MNRIWLIIQREYITRVRKWSFIVTTLLAPLAMAALFSSQIYLISYSVDDQRILVLDESGLFRNKIQNDSGGGIKVFYGSGDLSTNEKLMENGAYDGLLYIPKMNLDQPKGIQFFSENLIGLKTKSHLESQMENEIRRLRILESGLTSEFLSQLQPDIKIEQSGIASGKSGDTVIATIAGYIMAFIVYMVLFIYGTMVMRSVSEEKTNRIVEVVLSSIKPIHLMLGKIIGVGLVGLTQFILWGVFISITYGILGFIFAEQLMELQQYSIQPGLAPSNEAAELAVTMQNLQSVNWLSLISGFLFYFLGGYFFYAALFAAIGSAMGEDSDTQSMMFIVTAPIVLAIFISMTIVSAPNSNLAIWSSIIPFFSPIVMTARLPFGVPTWQIICSVIALVAGFIFTTWLAARIYRVGILIRGKKITLREIWRWI